MGEACVKVPHVTPERLPPPFLRRWLAGRPGSGAIPRSDHFDGREFHNLHGALAGRSLADVLRWKFLGGGMVAWPKKMETGFAVPSLPTEIRAGEAVVTFVGHSTFLVQLAGGTNLLTDPIWSERASPVAFAGPRRARRPGLAFETLPPVHIVLVSHNHYDHLDLPTLRRLDERDQPLFLTGLGNRRYLRGKGLRRVEEMDWWQTFPVPDPGPCNLEITFTPAQHWSARSVGKRNRTLWGGFWLRQGGNFQVFFAGDSAYGPHFQTIHDRLGTPDLAFLPIGAYEPRWFMREMHMNPDEAVQAHLTLAARESVGMHFGTFQLTDEGVDQPAEALASSLQVRAIGPESFRVPRFGETFRVHHTST